MSIIWNSLIDIQHLLEEQISQQGTEYIESGMDKFNRPNWINRVWKSQKFRRAHLDVVDARDTKGLWMMHCCIFPHIDSSGPIYGFDVVAGKNKITGCFHDFSPVSLDNEMTNWFSTASSKYFWKKQRQLPDWAVKIFSPNMIAAGNIQDVEEINQMLELVSTTTTYYLENIGKFTTDLDYSDKQNFYCHNQKLNSHTPKVMTSLGLDADEVNIFIHQCLFPEINEK